MARVLLPIVSAALVAAHELSVSVLWPCDVRFCLPLSAAALKANPWISQHRLARQMSLPSISSRLGASKGAFFDRMKQCLSAPVAHVAEINFATVEIEVVEHFLQ